MTTKPAARARAASEEATIAAQARELVQLRADNAELLDRHRQIRAILYGIGGPLNDNLLGYSREQLLPLFRIAELTV